MDGKVLELRNEARFEGISALIDIMRLLKCNDEQIINQLKSKFALSEKEAKQCLYKKNENEQYADYWRALLSCRKQLREAPTPDAEASQFLEMLQKEIERVSEWLDEDFWNVEEEQPSISIDLVGLTRYAKSTERTAKELTEEEVAMFRTKHTVESELADALYRLSFGKLTYEQAAEKAKQAAPNFDLNDEVLAYKGINWFAKEMLKKM